MNESLYRHTTCKAIALALCLTPVCIGLAQTTVVKDVPSVKGTTVVIPGREYKRSGYHNFFWGRHYRREWTTPVRVADFYLDTAAGGLTPYAAGGGRQSATLRLRNRQGKEYVLRSINKDFGRALPETMRGTFLSRVAKDQVSIGHPFSAITIVPMIEATGIYHTRPVIVFVPEQAALGDFNKEYGNQLYLFEERPDDDQQMADNFGFSRNVIGSEKLLEHRYKDNDHQVDQVAYVRARLFDMVIGDWGRHPDNWRWARFDEGKLKIYKPVPRDRDQAYTRIDGFYPSLAARIYKPFQGFRHTIKNIKDWNLPARPIDRLFLTELEKEEWMKEATSLQQVLTDSLITSSIHLLPPEQFELSGDELIEKLKSRRDHLTDYAADYYAYLATFTDLAGTADRELFRVNRNSDGTTDVAVYKITKEGDVRPEPVYSRKFRESETKEIRIYGLKGKDVVEVKGEPGSHIRMRIIDPGKDDSVFFAQKELHHRISIARGKKYEYDTLHQPKFDFSLRPIISSSRYKVFDNDPLKLFPRTGLKVVASITFTPEPWRKAEYENVHHLCANYGFFRQAFNAGYVGRFGRLIGGWDLVLKARLDAPAVENYFGTGNNTKNEGNNDNYYRTFSNRVYGGISVERNFARFHHAEMSVFYQSVKVESTNDHFISSGILDPSLFQPNHYAGVEGGYSFAKTNDRLTPTQGVGFNLAAGYIKNVSENNDPFLKVMASSFVYVPLSRQWSVAVRAAGGTIAGNAPYYYLNTVGGGGTGEVRGYDRERFYGKHSFHLNNDLRWIFNTHNWLFNGRAGLLGFYDIGRVWQPGEISDLWHDSYGFGIILVPYNKFSVTATYGISEEGGYTHFKAGLFF